MSIAADLRGLAALRPADVALTAEALRELLRARGERDGPELRAALAERPPARPGPVHDDPLRVARSVRRAGRLFPGGGNCLVQSLALDRMLRERGHPSELRIGVRREGEALAAHAWVEHDGRALLEAGLDQFSTLGDATAPRVRFAGRGDRDRAGPARLPARARGGGDAAPRPGRRPRERRVGGARLGRARRRLAAVGAARARRGLPAAPGRQLRDRARPSARAGAGAPRGGRGTGGRGAGLPGERPRAGRRPARARGPARERGGDGGRRGGLRRQQRSRQEHRGRLARLARRGAWPPRTCWCWSPPTGASRCCRAAAR